MSFKTIHNILLTSALLLGALTSCSDVPKSLNDAAQQVKERFGTLNVSDATMIYRKEEAGRARSSVETGYFKLDVNGNEVKLVIKGEKGKTTDISIDWIRNISDRFMIFMPSNNELKEEVGEYDGFFYAFVDRGTDKIYLINPAMLYNDGTFDIVAEALFETGGVAITSDGSIYFYPAANSGECMGYILKVNTRDFSISSVLPEGQHANQLANVGVSSDGYVIFDRSKVLLPSGGIQIIEGSLFMFDNQIYSASDTKLYKWTPETSGRLASTEVAAFVSPIYSEIMSTAYNYVRKSVLITDQSLFYEFNGKELALIDNSIVESGLRDFYTGYPSHVETSKAWYFRQDNKFTKLNLADWSVERFSFPNYEPYEISANIDSPEIAFSGLRSSDAASVFGAILPDNTLRIDGETPAQN